LLEDSNRKILSMERKFGKFTKEFTINSEIDRDSLKANYANGVLSISVGKFIPEKTGRTIEIK
jgi:HSP20 family molecular chaperone IbpA